MELVKRKRVTRVGSGAFSVYLPKKWIDAWLPEQQKEREVDLHRINQSLLIVPVIQDRSERGDLEPTRDEVLRRLLSAYVRGLYTVRYSPSGPRFDNDTIAAARDTLRRLDERLQAVVGPREIGFDLKDQPAPFRSGAQLIELLAARLADMTGLLAETVDTYGTDPERALHAARLLASIHEEDVVRLYLQSLRLVATLELPLETVADFQILDLTAASYHAMAGQAVDAVGVVMASWGLGVADLAYPRADLVKRIGRQDAPPVVAREILQGYRRSFDDLAALLGKLGAALAGGDGQGAARVETDARAALRRHQERLFTTVLGHWGETTPDGPRTGFIAYQLSQPIANLFAGIAEAAGRARILLGPRASGE